MTKVTVALSRKVSDGAYGSFSATIGLEDEVPSGTNRDSFATGLRVWCKAFLDETLGDLREEYLAASGAVDESIEEKFQENIELAVGGSDLRMRAAAFAQQAEEKPPLPSAYEKSVLVGGRESEPAPGEEVRTPLDEAGNELRSFQVQSFEVAETSGGDKFLKVFGGPWKRPWIPAWKDVAEELSGFQDIDEMDLQVYGPPFPVKAFVKMGEYKGRPSPDQVVSWERIGG